MPEELKSSTTFNLSKDLNSNFKLKICKLEGYHDLESASTRFTNPSVYKKLSSVDSTSDLIVTVCIIDNGNLVSLPVSTSYVPFKNARSWNQWLVVPIHYSQLALDSHLDIKIYEIVDNVKELFGSCITKVFNDDNTLKRGRQLLPVTIEGHKSETIRHDTEAEDIESKLKLYETNDIKHIDWLDDLSFPKINKVLSTSKKPHNLLIEFLKFEIPIVYSDLKYSNPRIPSFMSIDVSPVVLASNIKIVDYDQYRDDPIEIKYRKLERSHKDGPLDRELKPSPKIRDELNKILLYPSIKQLNDFEKNLVWKFRYYLTRDKKALTKFLKSINWDNNTEMSQVIELLPKWAVIDIDDSLELLNYNYTQSFIRSYAVERLEKANDDELMLYLLQLVQALNYEYEIELRNNSEYQLVEFNNIEQSTDSLYTSSPLANFLISRAIKNPILGSFFYWYVKVESEDSNSSKIYSIILKKFLSSLANQPSVLSGINKQVEFIDKLTVLYNKVKSLKNETTPRKVELLRQYLNNESKYKLLSFERTPLPLNPSIEVIGCVPAESSVFKSSLSPLKITLKTTTGLYPIMFKIGDDLRQDQLVVQIITLMDNLLKNENLDLRLTPYKIIATNPIAGAIQFVPNSTLTSVLNQYHGILPFLQAHSPDSTEPLGVSRQVMDTYVKSCAGYCVITYILGVGDRHLDNLLICPDGRFFHADFGYILGQDPKPFPPLMKLPIQIIEGMGGLQSANFKSFTNYCFVAFSTLRKNSNLILNLFQLMIDANIPDIKKDRERVIYKLEEKFCLEMSEEEATLFFTNLINDSVNAFLPVVIDRLHTLAQYWRA